MTVDARSGSVVEIAADCRRDRRRIREHLDRVVAAIASSQRPEAWIHVADAETLRRRVESLHELVQAGHDLPLLGVPFAVKDNIAVAGMPTTAGCPAYSYRPERDATVVAALLSAGAICVGKTHMDQFATGLVGTRAPQGPCRNAHHLEYISGGSSSGSAVVVAQGIVPFALGTDTAGSGRVPAALNGIIGLKPTRGILSLEGVVPACLSLDCVSVFARSAGDAAAVYAVLQAGPQDHPYCRAIQAEAARVDAFRFGFAPAAQLEQVDDESRELYQAGVERLRGLGGTGTEIDYRPFLETSRLLYGGPWIAERATAVGDFIQSHRDEVDPVVAQLILAATHLTARQAFDGLHALQSLRRRADEVWQDIDVLALPALPRLLRIDQVRADPIATNSSLGIHHNFLNLLDLCAVAAPCGQYRIGVPFGLTLIAPAFSDDRLLDLAARLIGEAEHPRQAKIRRISFVVVGAHLSGMPLNASLVKAGGQLEAVVTTSAEYRLFALRGTVPPKPGLQRVNQGGAAIEAEVWSLPADQFGAFVAAIPAPLGMGRITLADGSQLPGFICEPTGFEGATDITEYGGWRAYIAAASSRPT